MAVIRHIICKPQEQQPSAIQLYNTLSSRVGLQGRHHNKNVSQKNESAFSIGYITKFNTLDFETFVLSARRIMSFI
jgi:hypothetical protein